MYSPGGLQPAPGVWIEPVECEPFGLARVLHACLLQVVQDHGREVLLLLGFLLGHRAVLIVVGGGEHAMRREAFDRERAGHTHALVVLVRLVVERFGVGVAGDGRVDLLARHPFVDIRVVGDRLERDVRHALVDEAFADVVAGRIARWRRAGQFRFLLDPLGRVGQQIVGIFGAHQPRACQRQRHAAGVAGDPAPSPLLGDIGGRAAAAGRVEHEVAGVGGHEEAALDDLR